MLLSDAPNKPEKFLKYRTQNKIENKLFKQTVHWPVNPVHWNTVVCWTYFFLAHCIHQSLYSLFMRLMNEPSNGTFWSFCLSDSIVVPTDAFMKSVICQSFARSLIWDVIFQSIIESGFRSIHFDMSLIPHSLLSDETILDYGTIDYSSKL